MSWNFCEECGRKFESYHYHELWCEDCFAKLADAEMEDDFEADSGVFCVTCGLMVQEVHLGECRQCWNAPKDV